jgi:hypothetical protein
MEKICWNDIGLTNLKKKTQPFKTELVRDSDGNNVTRKYYKHSGCEGAEVSNFNPTLQNVRGLDLVPHMHVVFGDCPSGTTKFGDYNLHVRTDTNMSCEGLTFLTTLMFGSAFFYSRYLDDLGRHPESEYVSRAASIILGTLAYFYSEDVCKYYFPESGTRIETWEQFNICTLVPPLTCEIVNECSVI